jgi:putative lipoic acid-binding regulatory protein
VDEKTGEVINEYGATRFDVAVRALRGDFDPPPGADNTERAAGLLLDSLVQWPARYDFQFVLRSGGAAPAALTEELRAVVAAACQSDVAPEACTAKERKGGKYVSVTVPCTVRAPQLIQRVFDALEGDDRVIMKY